MRSSSPSALVLLALVLAGCAGHLAAPAALGNAVPPAGPTQPPTLADKHFIADDGTPLPLRVWLPEGKPRAVLLALHGFDDYSNAFAAPAAAWAEDGIATYAYDQRGFGEASPRGRWVGARQLDEDMATGSWLLRARYPGVPLYLLGESMGGAVVVTGVTGAAGAPRPDADGVILAAPAVWGRATMNVFVRLGLWIGDKVFPGLTLTGRALHIMPSDNIEMLRGQARDPLVIKQTRVDTINGLVDLMDLALASAPRLNRPMLLLYGDHDEIVPKRPTQLWIDNLPSRAHKTRKIAWYPNGFHMLLRGLDARQVWRDIESWIDDHAAPLPSRADRHASEVLCAGR